MQNAETVLSVLQPALRSIVDPDRPVFLPSSDMPARIAAECERTGESVPDSPAALVRCVLDSLDAVHLVGGGARNELRTRATSRCWPAGGGGRRG